MGFWSNLFGWESSSTDDSSCGVNPATGLPMIDGCGSFDVGGSPYGTDLHDDWTSGSGIGMDSAWDATSPTWDTFSSSNWDDSFGNSWD